MSPIKVCWFYVCTGQSCKEEEWNLLKIRTLPSFCLLGLVRGMDLHSGPVPVSPSLSPLLVYHSHLFQWKKIWAENIIFFVGVMLQNKLKHVQRRISVNVADLLFLAFPDSVKREGFTSKVLLLYLRSHSQILAGNCTFHPSINSRNRNSLLLNTFNSQGLWVSFLAQIVRKWWLQDFFCESVSKGCLVPILTLGTKMSPN